MKQSMKRLPAFLLALAVTLVVTVGAFAYDDQLEESGFYAENGIMALAATSLPLSVTGSSVNLTVSGFPGPWSGMNGKITSFSSSIDSGMSSSSNVDYYPGTVNASGSLTSVTLGASTSIPVSGPGYLHVSGSLSYLVWIGGSIAQTRSYSSNYNDSRFSRYSTSPLSLYPVSVDLLFGGQVVGSQTLSGSSNQLTVDFLVPVESSISSVALRLNYGRSVNKSFTYSLDNNNYVGRASSYRFRNSVSGGGYGFIQAGFVSQSISYEFTELSLDEQILAVLKNISNSVNSLVSSSSQQSPMDKFESDYLNNSHVSGQLSKAEEMMSPNNPALPNSGDVGGFVQDLQNGMGLNGSAFDSQAFQDASQAFSGPDSYGEGGMWSFFTQEVADDLEVSNPNSREAGSIDTWIADSERRWSKWWTP